MFALGRGFQLFDFDDFEGRVAVTIFIAVIVASGFVAQIVRVWCLSQAAK